MTDLTETRPWGMFRVLLDGDTCKTKLIAVNPDKRLSLQRHKCRAEHWFVVSGQGGAVVEDDLGTLIEYSLTPGAHINIPAGKKHRLWAGNLGIEIIEIQTGSSFDESDIERFEDDFNRL